MKDEEQIKFLRDNIKISQDFCKFYNEEKFINYLDEMGDKYPDEILKCFQPDIINPKLWREWSNDYFDGPPDMETVVNEIATYVADLDLVLLFDAIKYDDGQYNHEEGGHQIFLLKYDNFENKLLRNYLMHLSWDIEAETHLFIFHKEALVKDALDTSLASYINSKNNMIDQYSYNNLAEEIKDCKIIHKDKLIKQCKKMQDLVF